MQGFLQQNNSLIWTLNHETVRIEPWGRDSLRVRATVSAGIRDDLLSVLLPPVETDRQITIGEESPTTQPVNNQVAAEPACHVSASPY